MYHKFEFDVNNNFEIYESGKIAKQCNGSALLRVGNSVILATITVDYDSVADEDFLPLTVQYIEKAYSASKFPAGFVKREGKPSDFETLTSRIVDRSIRPLFPKSYKHPTQVTILVLSVDNKSDLPLLALNATSAAIMFSDLPFKSAICGVRVAKIENQIVINPTYEDLKKSTLDLFVAGTKEQLLMIEMRTVSSTDLIPQPISLDPIIEPMSSEFIKAHNSNSMPEDEFIEILEITSLSIKKATTLYEESFLKVKKTPIELQIKESGINLDIYNFIKDGYIDELKFAISQMARSERHSELKALADKIFNKLTDVSLDDVKLALEKVKKELVRSMILAENRRADGRNLSELRKIEIESNILPSTHGSILFTRGQTQALVVATIGSSQDAQTYDLLTDKSSLSEKFMVHYNFPGFSVGEVSKIGPAGRRELGHGNLAKRAIEPTIDKDFDSTIRVVSEILESNGSSSMATVCGGSLVLKACGIPTSELVAGIAMGLVIENGKYAILSDITGLEDHDGDMDFKVAGTKDGITALQMDIKVSGLDLRVLKEALYQAKDGRVKILNIMEEAEKEIKINESILPSSHTFAVHPSKIVDIIGQAGKTIKEIIERFGVAIDLDRDKGNVKIVGGNKDNVKAAMEHIKTITKSNSSEPAVNLLELYKAGEVFRGKVKKVVDFGAFVELPRGQDGLLHVSKLSNKRVSDVRELIKEGEEIDVEVLSVSKNRVELAKVEG